MSYPNVVLAITALSVFVVVLLLWIIPLFNNSATAVTNFRMHSARRGFKVSGVPDLSWWQTIRYKLMGLKQRLLTAFIVIAGGTILLYDTVVPALLGVDFTPITSKIDPRTLMGINVAVPLIMLWFRKLAERRSGV